MNVANWCPELTQSKGYYECVCVRYRIVSKFPFHRTLSLCLALSPLGQLQLVRSLVVDVDSVVPFARSSRTELPLAQPLLVKSPMIVGCPDRTLSREDDSRGDVL